MNDSQINFLKYRKGVPFSYDWFKQKHIQKRNSFGMILPKKAQALFTKTKLMICCAKNSSKQLMTY